MSIFRLVRAINWNFLTNANKQTYKIGSRPKKSVNTRLSSLYSLKLVNLPTSHPKPTLTPVTKPILQRRMDYDEDRIYYSYQNLQTRDTNGGAGGTSTSLGNPLDEKEDIPLMAVRRHFREFLRKFLLY